MKILLKYYVLVTCLLFCGGTLLAQKWVYAPEISFQPQGGFYQKTTQVTLLHSKGKTIYYTLDGSEPTLASSEYQNPITIDSSVVIRAAAFEGEKKVCRIESSTYFINEPETDWLVVSVAIPPQLLFDSLSGLFQVGKGQKVHGRGNYGANYWDRKERQMNVEIFESNDSCVYRSPAGWKLFGGMSRTFPQKSLVMSSRLRYGNKRFKHRFFESTKIKKFKHLLLRNAGSDWNQAHGRDVIIGKMIEDWDLDKQASRPCHVYLNGKYWGVYYLREKINTYFLGSHHGGIQPDTIDLIEHRWALRKGSKKGYTAMLEFIEKSNLAEDEHYHFLNTLMNIENYTDYKMLQIFIDNVDAGGNIKFWRADTYDRGRWNWILYDTDWGFGLMRHDAYKRNSFNFHTKQDGPNWPNPPWSTLILRKLLENQKYRQFFANRFCDRLNTSLRTDSMLNVINAHHDLVKGEMPRQFDKWKGSKRLWKVHYNRMRNFAKKRPAFIWDILEKEFEGGAKVPVSVRVEGRGSVWVNDNIKCSYKRPFDGHYFQNIPITLHAKPRLGFEFSHWEGTTIKSPKLEVDLFDKKHKQLKAVFVPIHTPLKDSIMFNEVSVYNKQTGDWIEIYNSTNQKMNTNQWILKNKKNEFILGEHWLEAKDYMILARDTARFLNIFPMYKAKLLGNFDFGLNKESDRLELYTKRGAVLDTFRYDIQTPRSDFTIDLKSPLLDNGIQANWEVKYGTGSPANVNPGYWYETTSTGRNHWSLIGLILGGVVCLVFIIRNLL